MMFSGLLHVVHIGVEWQPDQNMIRVLPYLRLDCAHRVTNVD